MRLGLGGLFVKNKIIQGILQLIGIMAVGAVVGYSIGKPLVIANGFIYILDLL